MTQRIGCLNGNNITFDSDLTMANVATLDPGIIEGLEVTSSGINPGKALIKVTRSEGPEMLLPYENTEKITSINTTGTKKIFIEIDQSKIDSGENNAEDGSGIAEIKASADFPENNYIALATIENSIITDKRVLIKIKDNILNQSDLGEVTKMGNEFNKPEKLVKLNEDGKFPALDGSNIKNIQSSVPNSSKNQKGIVQQHTDSEIYYGNVDNKYLSAVQLKNAFYKKGLDRKLISTTTWHNESTKKTLPGLTFNNNTLRKIEFIWKGIGSSSINLSVNNNTSSRSFNYYYNHDPYHNISSPSSCKFKQNYMKLTYLYSNQTYYELHNLRNFFNSNFPVFHESMSRGTCGATPSSIQIYPDTSISMIVKVYERSLY